jgi:AmmeMemoRadiSam system protein B
MVARTDRDLDRPESTPPKASRVRPPRFAGAHYPGEPHELRRMAAELTAGPLVTERALGLVLPHGPWRYVGRAVGAAIARARLEETVVVLAPNHEGRGPRSAIVCDGAYALPGGVQVPIEEALAESIRALGGLAEVPEVFLAEHAIEDLLPLLLARQPRLSIVPIAIHDVSAAMAARIGAALADAIVGRGGGVTVVATTDLAHYAPRVSVAAFADPIEHAAAALDEEALVTAFRARLDGRTPIVETCGLGALLTFVHAMRALGLTDGEVVARGDSSVFEPDAQAVVAWASLYFATAGR